LAQNILLQHQAALQNALRARSGHRPRPRTAENSSALPGTIRS